MNKILLTIGSVTALAAPIAAVVSCTSWDNPDHVNGLAQQTQTPGVQAPAATLPDDSVDLTAKGSRDWHALFHDGGRTLPDTGQGIYVVVAGKKYGFVWTAADSAQAIPSGFVNGHPGDGAGTRQVDIVNYLASRISAANNNAVTPVQVRTAFALPTPGAHQFTSTVTPVSGVPTDGGVVEAV